MALLDQVAAMGEYVLYSNNTLYCTDKNIQGYPMKFTSYKEGLDYLIKLKENLDDKERRG